jgi:AcrR family transcriptional regulator
MGIPADEDVGRLLTFIMNNVHDEAVVGRPRTRAERLDQEVIVAAALHIAGSRGVEGLTMRTLTAELQVSVGAVYNHVRDRRELLDLVADEVLRRSPSLRGGVEDPWAAIIEHTIGIQDLLDQYAGLDVVVMQRSPNSSTSKRVRSDFVRLLEAHGVSTADAHHVRRSVTWLWLGARISLGGRPQTPSERAYFARTLNDLVDALRRSVSKEITLTVAYPQKENSDAR